MKFDIKQFSYLQMNEKWKKNTKSIYWRQKKTKHDYSFTKTFFVTWNMAGSPVFLWFFGNLCNSAPLKFLWKAAYVSRTG